MSFLRENSIICRCVSKRAIITFTDRAILRDFGNSTCLWLTNGTGYCSKNDPLLLLRGHSCSPLRSPFTIVGYLAHILTPMPTRRPGATNGKVLYIVVLYTQFWFTLCLFLQFHSCSFSFVHLFCCGYEQFKILKKNLCTNKFCIIQGMHFVFPNA